LSHRHRTCIAQKYRQILRRRPISLPHQHAVVACRSQSRRVELIAEFLALSHENIIVNNKLELSTINNTRIYFCCDNLPINGTAFWLKSATPTALSAVSAAAAALVLNIVGADSASGMKYPAITVCSDLYIKQSSTQRSLASPYSFLATSDKDGSLNTIKEFSNCKFNATGYCRSTCALINLLVKISVMQNSGNT